MLDMRKQFCPPGFWTAKKIHISQDLSRKNYLSKRVVQFHGIVTDRDGKTTFYIIVVVIAFYFQNVSATKTGLPITE